MDGFLARRVTDTRFQNERRVSGPSTGGEWYLANQHTTVSQHTFSASEYKPADSNHKMTPHKGDEGTEKKSKIVSRGHLYRLVVTSRKLSRIYCMQ